MPKTVRDLPEWHKEMANFKEFAITQDAEFQFNVLPDGRESITVRAWYRPRKEKKQ